MNEIILGGILPALLIGGALTFLKIAASNGVGAGTGMMVVGLGVFVAGAVAHLFGLSGLQNSRAVLSSFLVGIFWGTGSLLMSYTVGKGFPMAVAASLAAANVVVVVALSLFVLGESASLSVVQLLGGVLAILIGSILVTMA